MREELALHLRLVHTEIADLLRQATGGPQCAARRVSSLARLSGLTPVARKGQRAAGAAQRPEPGTQEHTVGVTDTLPGIALRYGVTVRGALAGREAAADAAQAEAIRRANRMLSDEVAAYRTLTIPAGALRPRPAPPVPAAVLATVERKKRERMHEVCAHTHTHRDGGRR
jgi:hypothetical protein